MDSRPSISDYALFTIGYEGKTVEHFTNELIKEDVRVLCDIRKNAFSMKYGFSKTQLKFVLENIGIKYIHIPGLGIDSNKRKKLNSKKIMRIFSEIMRRKPYSAEPGHRSGGSFDFNGRDIIIIQIKANRLGMLQMGQAYFSR